MAVEWIFGAYGNTPQATLSPPQVVQVLSPDTGFEKYQVGQQVTITWHTAGLTLESPVSLIDAGGGPIDDFSQDFYQTGGGTETTTNTIDTSGVTIRSPSCLSKRSGSQLWGWQCAVLSPGRAGRHLHNSPRLR